MGKSTESVSVIGGADGPSSVLIARQNSKKSMKQSVHKLKYNIKKYFVERKIQSGTHTMDEVLFYIVEELGLQEMNRDILCDTEEYKEMRASFLMQYRADFLGEYEQQPVLADRDPDSVREYIDLNDERHKCAMEIPSILFDIDMHKFTKEYSKTDGNLDVVIEMNYNYIGGNASGKVACKKLNKILKQIYLFYGVNEEDIKYKTDRYKNLVSALCI